MSIFENNFISLYDLGIAYRKVKVDLYYISKSRTKEIFDYENNLELNLNSLLDRLQNGIPISFEGETWSLVPKKIIYSEPTTDIINSEPQSLWDSIIVDNNKIKAEFRLIEKLSIDFHILSVLWINKVGEKFERKLSNSARGNRLRRNQSGDLNDFSLGSLMPYLYAYSNWRDDAFKVMEKSLDEEKSIVTLTADVTSFYHKLDVSFMLNSDFLEKIGVKLNNNERNLHYLFIDLMDKWAKNTPLKMGLPVGLVTSAVIANVALFELDQIIKEEVVPLYYGRYVDDIILVMENGSNFKSNQDVWNWLIERMNSALNWKKNKNLDVKDNKELEFKRAYLENSEIIFANDKNKLFILKGYSGKAILKSIIQEVSARTSEWRSLPEMPNNPNHLEAAFLSTIQADGTSADSLRKADKISVRRAGFALKLRDIEAYSRALPPKDWERQRHTFLSAYIRHILILPTFFDFFNYLPRIISIATNSSDFNILKQVLDALELILKKLETCDCTIKGMELSQKELQNSDYLSCFKEHLKVTVSTAIETSFPLRLSQDSKIQWNMLFNGKEEHSLLNQTMVKELQNIHKHFIVSDLAYHPLKQFYLSSEKFKISKKLILNMSSNDVRKFMKSSVIDGCEVISRFTKFNISKMLPSGLIFPVRPMSIHDLYLLHQNPFSIEGQDDITKALIALRGFKPENNLPKSTKTNYTQIEIQFKRKKNENILISVASWKTDMKSWIASVSQNPDPDLSRLERLNRLINQIIRCRETPNYLVFPELSIPSNWFLAIIGKLQKKGISLICGIEYIHASSKIVHNQVWAALSHDSLGFPTSMIYRQDKQRPAFHEELELKRVSGKIMKPELKPWNSPPIVVHGGFHFAILICSELTNIANRTALRGNIDALFVPEWNQDTESYNSLVESSALDIHAYIIQCNDRQYGDSRIRAPFKDSWLRDIVRVKGGVEDYFVTGLVNIQTLRSFQSCNRSPEKPFKPVPDGFKIAYCRKSLPLGVKDE